MNMKKHVTTYKAPLTLKNMLGGGKDEMTCNDNKLDNERLRRWMEICRQDVCTCKHHLCWHTGKNGVCNVIGCDCKKFEAGNRRTK